MAASLSPETCSTDPDQTATSCADVGYMQMLADCYVCKRPFYSNPNFVPSLRLQSGAQAVFCKGCMEHVNELRRKAGNPTLYVHPQAYTAEEV